MAGQIDVPGNAYLGNAEFNSWFDPEATQIVLRAAVPHFVIPLDYTNNVSLTQAVFDQIAKHKPQTVITKLFAKAFGPTVAPGTFIYDTNAKLFLFTRNLLPIQKESGSICITHSIPTTASRSRTRRILFLL
jgi:inosine-uridine nucleoside N-ribohydrolase